MALPRHHSASIRRAGATSFVPTWRCWPGPTCSPWKSLPSKVWSRAFLHPAGDAARVPGRDHAVSGPAVDGAAGAKRNDEGLGLSGTQSLPAARSRRQVLSGVSRGDPSRQGQAPEVAGTQSEPKCVCRALGTLGERGMPVAVDLFRRAFVASRLNGVYRPFPPRTESSGQREQASVSPTTRTGPTLPPGNCAMQRTTRWLTAILRGPSSMNTGSDYYFDRTANLPPASCHYHPLFAEPR